MIQQTSQLAFSLIQDQLPARQQQVFDCISTYGPMNNKQIARQLLLGINQITPRVLELRQKGRVELDRTDVDAQGRRCRFWRAA